MPRRRGQADVQAGAVPSANLVERFPDIELPLQPGYAPMEAASVDEIPEGPGWLYEPKWDGFRCIAYRAGETVALASKAGQPLGRYFPEVVAALAGLPHSRFALDGEIVIFADGGLDFDALLQRIHPAESRIRRLAAETPGTYLVFDLLVDETGQALVTLPLADRRARLERFAAGLPPDGRVRLSPTSTSRDEAERWMREQGGGGLDGVIAKRLDVPYRSGDRTGMRKIKRLRTADCVVGGFRYAQAGGEIGSLLLGLYDDEDGLLHHVGFSSSFTAEERRALKPILEPLVEPPGFTGSAPGGPSRWTAGRNTEWQPLRPSLVCEVRYDHFSGGRFRHGTKFLRWRPDKPARQCTFAQVERRPGGEGLARFDLRGG